MATDIARSINNSSDSLAGQLINVTQRSSELNSVMQGFTIDAITTSNDRLMQGITETNNSISSLVSSLGSDKNEYTPITIHLRRIGQTLNFISAKQLPLMTEFLSKNNEELMRAYELESQSFKYQHKMSAATRRMMKELANERPRSGQESTGPEVASPAREDSFDPGSLFKPGGIFFALAASMGVFVGVIAGQIKAIQSFSKLLTPRWVQKQLKSGIGNIRASFTKAFDSFAKSLSSLKNTNIGKVFVKIKTAFKAFTKPFVELGKMIGPYVKTMGGIVGKIAPLVSKIFAPIAIIMGVVDAVQGAMAGYEKGGIGGMVFGAIQGLMNSLIMKPLDLLKDLVSWVAEKLGFENFSKALDSFSFEEIFTGLTDKLIDLSADFNNKLKQIVKGILPDKDSFMSKFIPDAVYEWADGYKPPKDAIQTKQDKSMQGDALSLMETPKKSLTKVVAAKKGWKDGKPLSWHYNQYTGEKPNVDSPAMTATKQNQQIKQDAADLKEQNKAQQVDASTLISTSNSTITNIATVPPRPQTNPDVPGARGN
jgi:hypothetical protein